MKRSPLSLGVLMSLMLSGCSTYLDIQGEEAQQARQLMAKHCVVGTRHIGGPPTTIFVREGLISKRPDNIRLRSRHKMDIKNIVIHSIRDLENGWLIADASAKRVRENFYVNLSSGAFFCSEDEWWGNGGKDLQKDY